jgi:ankyrin repeat protein
VSPNAQVACNTDCPSLLRTFTSQLLPNKSRINQCDKEKKTPLFIACEEGYIDIVKLLIENKCEIFNHSLNGQTVLHAVCSGHAHLFLSNISTSATFPL